MKIAAELLVERLVEWGVEVIFGLPGDGINGVMEALRRHRERIRFVLVHHEESAAFMATGYAKTTGRLGVCLATSGPGGIHLLNGLYDAKLDHAPVLAITGMQSTAQLGTGYHQEVHLERLLDDVSEYNAMIQVPVSVPSLVDIAVRTAIARRGVSHLTFPVDIQTADAELDPFGGSTPVARIPDTSAGFEPGRLVPAAGDLRRAADLLNRGRRVVILAGVGSLGAREEVGEVSDLLAAPIVKTLPAKAAVPDDHPNTTGGVGLLGTRPSQEALEEADTLLMLGTDFPYTKYLPEEAKVVQVDIEPLRIGNRIPVDVPLTGDVRSTVRALVPLLERKTERDFLAEAQDGMRSWREMLAKLETPDRHPIQPQYLARCIDRHADSDAILAADSGTIASWAARHFDMRGDRRFLLCSNLASMAAGLPYTIAAQVASPGRQCITLIGDGGFAMLMAEFLTAVRYGLPVKVFVVNNGGLGQIQWEQMVLGYPEFGVRWERPARFAAWAEACGGLGLTVEDPAELDHSVAAALHDPRPALVDVVVNPNEPLMPPKVEYEQAKHFAEAFLKGQPRRAAIARSLFRDKLDQLKQD
ncbi:MAG TPA: thiamine pyrophosphate-binding protein [Actinomycetota bacterium]|nr:thiamine pyrophosphate-binding protein [Actinomycetota bacterium]